MIGSVKNFSSGKMNKALENLNDKIYNFLKEYDKNRDGKISVSELEIKRFAQDLRKN